jgi:hypothetical protein
MWELEKAREGVERKTQKGEIEVVEKKTRGEKGKEVKTQEGLEADER